MIQIRRVFIKSPELQIDNQQIVYVVDNDLSNKSVVIYKNVPYYAQEGKGCCPSPGGSTPGNTPTPPNIPLIWFTMYPRSPR